MKILTSILIFLLHNYAQAQVKPLLMPVVDSAFIAKHTYKDLDAALKNPNDVYGLDLSHTLTITQIFQLKKIRNLRKLDFVTYQKKFPFEVSQLENLQELRLIGDSLDFADIFIKLSSLKNLKKLSLTRNKFEVLPQEITKLTQITALDISNCYFLKLIDALEKITQLPNLENLDISKKDPSICTFHFDVVPTTDFVPSDIDKNEKVHFEDVLVKKLVQLKKLKVLNLSNCQLERLPVGLEKLTNLVSLDVSNNEKLGFSSEVLDKLSTLPNLKKLKIQFNQDSLTVLLPKEIIKFTQLTHLDLSGSSFEHFPKELVKLRKLESLKLDNSISVLSSEIGELINLEELSLAGNDLTNLPRGIKRLLKLKQLDLSHNSFKIFPKEIGDLPNLINLNLQYNELEIISGDIGQLKKLEYLDLKHNELTSLPKELENLSFLKILYLDNNPLTTIFTSLFPFLERLDYGNSEDIEQLIKK